MADQGSEGLLSPFLRRRRSAVVRRHIDGYVLDVGCGTGSMARDVGPERYLGVEVDPESLAAARRIHPAHRFEAAIPAGRTFDTILALAVIEHVDSPADTLRSWAHALSPSGRIVLTTPHPRGATVHRLGAAMGMFSRHAAEEHKDFLDKPMLESAAAEADLVVLRFEPFLLGLNQLAILGRRGD